MLTWLKNLFGKKAEHTAPDCQLYDCGCSNNYYKKHDRRVPRYNDTDDQSHLYTPKSDSK